MPAMRDENVQLNDLVNDARFIRWVQAPDDETRAYWDGWLRANPDKKELVEEGQQLVAFLHFKTPAPSAQEFWEVRERIKAEIREDEWAEPEPTEAPPPAAPEPQEPFSRYYQLAAVWIGILLVALGTFLYFQTRHAVSYRTGFGETRVVWLPDQSQVTLNANSSVTFYRNWPVNSPREVWLKGEAYLDVRPTGAAQPAGPLVVHAAGVQVVARGARLDVQHRRGKVRVLTDGGEARVRMKEGAGAPLRLGPGEAAEVNDRDKTVRRLRIKPEMYTAWRSHRLVFEETPLREIAHALEDHFGLVVQLTTPDLAERRFTGALSTRDLPALLAGLSGPLGVRISQQPGRIIVESTNP